MDPMTALTLFREFTVRKAAVITAFRSGDKSVLPSQVKAPEGLWTAPHSEVDRQRGYMDLAEIDAVIAWVQAGGEVSSIYQTAGGYNVSRLVSEYAYQIARGHI